MFTSVRTAVVTTAAAAALSMSAPVPALAQTEPILKSFFEGRRVTVKIDMPGTSDGVDVQGDAREAIAFPKYRDNLKRYGTAIRAGDRVTVTVVKVKKDLIEFQLGGGGARRLRRFRQPLAARDRGRRRAGRRVARRGAAAGRRRRAPAQGHAARRRRAAVRPAVGNVRAPRGRAVGDDARLRRRRPADPRGLRRRRARPLQRHVEVTTD